MQEKKTIINGENSVLGRLASNISKRLLKGENIAIVNAEKIILSGNKKFLLEKYFERVRKRVKGNPRKGPKYSRTPDRIVKNAIRKMMPRKSKRTITALKKLEVFISVPKELEGKEIERIKGSESKVSKGFVEVGEISKLLGAKW